MQLLQATNIQSTRAFVDIPWWFWLLIAAAVVLLLPWFLIAIAVMAWLFIEVVLTTFALHQLMKAR